MLNYYRPFTANAAQNQMGLQSLIKGNKKNNNDSRHAFQKCKDKLANATLLTFLSSTAKLSLQSLFNKENISLKLKKITLLNTTASLHDLTLHFIACMQTSHSKNTQFSASRLEGNPKINLGAIFFVFTGEGDQQFCESLHTMPTMQDSTPQQIYS